MGELVRLTFPDRPQWLAGRSRGIGGSEAAAAIGRSPWKTALTRSRFMILSIPARLASWPTLRSTLSF
jgi:hypothetical protein